MSHAALREGTLLCCDYDTPTCTGFKPYLRVQHIREGSGQLPKYTMDYDAAIGGIKPGATTVKSSDGAITIYDFSQQLLHIATRYYHPNGTLCKTSVYRWNDNQWLESIALTDGQGALINRKSYD